ncbi:hypothetical protein AB0H57_18085 [Micromonospora sp. NPDC050686]|uniref:hypothetical protein n=1 Tax=Micromonospora sp. NPDC050686 TaxID=3154631 RepID=UPI0033F02414
MVAPQDRAGDPSAERRTLRGRLSRHYQQLDGGGRGAVLSALIGLVAALIAAGATIYSVVGQDDGGGPPASTPAAGAGGPGETSPAPSFPTTSTSSPSTDPPSTGAAPTDPTSAPPPPADEVQWSGEVQFNDDGIDFDPVPPTVEMDWPVFDSDLERISANEDGKLHAENGHLALWPGPGLPTRQQCLERLATHGDEWMRIPLGRTGCLRTSKDRIVSLTIARYPDDSFRVTAKATVWNSPEDS